MPYSKLAYVYDVLMEDAPYDEWQTFINDSITKYNPHAETVLDLGCGTGEMSIRLSQEGFRVTGVDNSEDMLSYAQDQANDQRANVEYLQQDIRHLEGFMDYDVITSLCDVINYITEVTDLQAVFTNVAKALSKDGVFIFDVHSPRYIDEEMVGGTFAEIYDDLSYLWLCEAGEEKGEVIHDLTFFIEDEDTGLYQRFDETHIQRTFPVWKYRWLLEQAGLQIKSIHADFSVEPTQHPEMGDRIFFVCMHQSNR
ncbi:methyltransferase [Gracilibacillus halophilus YIM-C55.5]|uniref:Methyltransferase n=1 Tax=Gracilibacillus halophilus YIM-C55.5 TaxID=1308866 RepID=N4WN99_9BACI|nr:class I SAM-dependent methyltransferase [Gracilibacillus halophilus]ENH97587.1 methyltransferase [Gracilibacillus halophilus YIM-C55.5]